MSVDAVAPHIEDPISVREAMAGASKRWSSSNDFVLLANFIIIHGQLSLRMQLLLGDSIGRSDHDVGR
jgi:hypothetical protein